MAIIWFIVLCCYSISFFLHIKNDIRSNILLKLNKTQEKNHLVVALCQQIKKFQFSTCKLSFSIGPNLAEKSVNFLLEELTRFFLCFIVVFTLKTTFTTVWTRPTEIEVKFMRTATVVLRTVQNLRKNALVLWDCFESP